MAIRPERNHTLICFAVELGVLRGNHDVSRDTTRASAFDLFKALVAGLPHVRVVDDVLIEDDTGFIPFCPFTPVADQIRRLPHGLPRVFMHHDYTDFGGDHVIPTQLLAEKGILRVINGHDHLRRTERRHGVEVMMTGSMQPFSHAEDPDARLYITTTLYQLGDDVRNMNVRLALREGEVAPEDLDCLSLSIIRVTSTDDAIAPMNIDSLDVHAGLAQALEGLSIKETLMERLRDHTTVS